MPAYYFWCDTEVQRIIYSLIKCPDGFTETPYIRWTLLLNSVSYFASKAKLNISVPKTLLPSASVIDTAYKRLLFLQCLDIVFPSGVANRLLSLYWHLNPFSLPECSNSPSSILLLYSALSPAQPRGLSCLTTLAAHRSPMTTHWAKKKSGQLGSYHFFLVSYNHSQQEPFQC